MGICYFAFQIYLYESTYITKYINSLVIMLPSSNNLIN